MNQLFNSINIRILFNIIIFVNVFYICFNLWLENDNKEINEILYNNFLKDKCNLSKLFILLLNKNMKKE